MALFFATDGPWGAGIGPLTAPQVDDNFWDHEERIQNLENNPPVAVSVSNITISGSVLTFHMSNGDTYDVTAPTATFHWRGDFLPGTAYVPLDEVRVGGVGRVLVLIAHTSVDPFDIDREISGDPVYFLLEELGIIFADTAIDASRDLIEADFSRYHDVIPGSSGDDVTLVVPPEGSDFRPQPGTVMDFFMQDPTGQIIFEAGGGVTLRSPASFNSRAQYSTMSLLYRGDDVWDVSGDLEFV